MPSLIKNHRPSNFGVALFRVPIDISGGLIIGVYDFEAAVYGLNGAWSKEGQPYESGANQPF